MKFTISCRDLLKHLSSVGGLLPSSSSTLPILESMLFQLSGDNLSVSSTDLNTTVSVSIAVKSKDSGAIAIPGKILIEILKAIPDQQLEFDIDIKKGAVLIISDVGRYKILGSDAGDFPKSPELENLSILEVHGDVLSSAIDKTLFAVSNDELRPQMCGLFINISEDKTTFVSTDARRLIKYTLNKVHGSSNSSFVVPKKPMSVLKAILGKNKVKIGYNRTNASFSFDNISIVTNLINEKYPNYEAIIPKDNNNKLIIPKSELLSSVRRVSVFSGSSDRQVNLTIKKKSVEIVAEDIRLSNEAKESIKCDYTGDQMAIGFNSRLFMDLISSVDSEEVLMELSGPSKAVLIKPIIEGKKNDVDVLMLLMPLLITN